MDSDIGDFEETQDTLKRDSRHFEERRPQCGTWDIYMKAGHPQQCYFKLPFIEHKLSFIFSINTRRAKKETSLGAFSFFAETWSQLNRIIQDYVVLCKLKRPIPWVPSHPKSENPKCLLPCFPCFSSKNFRRLRRSDIEAPFTLVLHICSWILKPRSLMKTKAIKNTWKGLSENLVVCFGILL